MLDELGLEFVVREYIGDIAAFAALDELGPAIASAALLKDPLLYSVVWC